MVYQELNFDDIYPYLKTNDTQQFYKLYNHQKDYNWHNSILYLKNHIEDKTIHCDDYKNLNIYNAFITVDTYEDLDTIDKSLLIDGKMFRVNSPTVTYYYYDTQSNTFKPLLFDNVVFDDTSLLSNYLAQTKYYYEQAQDILSQVQQIKQEIEELRS